MAMPDRERFVEVKPGLACSVSAGLVMGWLARMAIICGFAVLAGLTSQSAHAAADAPARRNITVIGDSLGGSLWIGVYQHYQGRKDVEVERFSKISSGIVRYDFYDWQAAAEKLAEKPIDIIVMMIGGNDGQPIAVDGQRYREKLGTELWKTTYGERVEKLIKTFTDQGKRFYWVGMPVQRTAKDNDVGLVINAIFKQRCEKLGVSYIDSYSLFADTDGKYVTHLPDANGKRQLMRDKDGMHFTTAGVKLLGSVVAKQIEDDDKLAEAVAAEAAKAAEARAVADEQAKAGAGEFRSTAAPSSPTPTMEPGEGTPGSVASPAAAPAE